MARFICCWQNKTDYDRRALVETTMGRYKTIIGSNLRARSLPGQRSEAAVGIAVLTQPHSVRRTAKLRS